MQEFVKGGQARSRVFAGHLYDVLDVKAAEVQLKEQRGGKTRIFWAPKTRFVPVEAEPSYGDTPPGYPGAMVDDRERASLSEPPSAEDDLLAALQRSVERARELRPKSVYPDIDVVVDPDLKGDVAILVSTDPREYVADEADPAALWPGESLEAPLPPAQRTPGYDEDGHWTENVLTENPVEGRIHVEASHANALNELAFILANAMDAKGFNDLKDIDPESPAFNVTIGNKLMLAVGELAEAQEELRAGHSYAEIYEKDGKPEGFAVEIADAVYRLLHLAAALGIDIGLALLQKHEFNLTRPHKHGKQF